MVSGNIALSGTGMKIGTALNDRFLYDGKYQPHYGMQWILDSWSGGGPTMWASGYAGIKFFTMGLMRMAISDNGNVGIGTVAPNNYKLAVEGMIGARKVKVTAGPNWPDFVFDAAYKLPSLHDVETYITINKHLPDVPSAAEIEKDGHDLGDMNRVLLQKVEEQTLYLIDLKKENEKQQQQIDQLIEMIRQLQKSPGK